LGGQGHFLARCSSIRSARSIAEWGLARRGGVSSDEREKAAGVACCSSNGNRVATKEMASSTTASRYWGWAPSIDAKEAEEAGKILND